MIRPDWFQRPELVKCQHWQSMWREKHVPVLNEQLLKKETPPNVETQNRKEKGVWTAGWEPCWGDSTASLCSLERCSHTHITSLNSPWQWAGITGELPLVTVSQQQVQDHHACILTPSPPWLCCCPKPPIPPWGWGQQGGEGRWLCLVSYWKKFHEAGRKKGHLLFTQAMNSAVLVWRATQLVSFNSHMTLATGYKIKPIFISG